MNLPVSDLKIRNFRGLASLDLGSLARFNILVGVNGCGKTSILEAFSLVCGRGSPNQALFLAGKRDLPPPTMESDLPLRSLFHNGDTALEPTFEYVFHGSHRSLSIRPHFKLAPIIVNGRPREAVFESGQQEAGNSAKQIFGLTFQFSIEGKPRFRNFSQIVPPAMQPAGGFIEIQLQPVPDQTGVFFVQARQANSIGETVKVLDRLIETREEENFFELLRSIDPEVISLQASVRDGKPIIWVRKRDRQILLNVMGDGFCRLCLIATGVFSGNSKVVVVDEIDSGLHHSVMREFWKRLIGLSAKNDFQLVCATHDDDMLHEAAEAFASAPEDLAVFRLDPGKLGHPSVARYSHEQLLYSLESGVDPRG